MNEEAKEQVERYRCVICKEYRSNDDIIKRSIDFIRTVDGALVPGKDRFAVYCRKCDNFLALIDPTAAKICQDYVK